MTCDVDEGVALFSAKTPVVVVAKGLTFSWSSKICSSSSFTTWVDVIVFDVEVIVDVVAVNTLSLLAFKLLAVAGVEIASLSFLNHPKPFLINGGAGATWVEAGTAEAWEVFGVGFDTGAIGVGADVATVCEVVVKGFINFDVVDWKSFEDERFTALVAEVVCNYINS